jgi:hypothetical protein
MSYWGHWAPGPSLGPTLFPFPVAQTSQPRSADPARITERHVLQICRSIVDPNARSPGPRKGHLVRGSSSFDGLLRPDGASLRLLLGLGFDEQVCGGQCELVHSAVAQLRLW